MDGLLLFDKPVLWSSHDAVDFVRRKIGQKRVGHAGTLDPMASGLLILLLGSATKRMPTLSVLEKSYEGTLTLGLRTDTFDLEGKILEETDPHEIDSQTILSEFARFRGKLYQKPPAYSAVKVNGKKLYDYSRAGIAVTVESRWIEIFVFDVEAIRLPDIAFRIVCSKGTYVRTLCEDIGRALGCGAVLSALSRTRIGKYRLQDAVTADQFERSSLGEIARKLIL